MHHNQRDRVALVTGASSGLGLAIARQLTTAGYRVYGACRRPLAVRPPEGRFELLRMDVDDDLSVESAINELVEREGRLDIVISNAGWGIAGSLEDTSSAEALAQFQTNFFGTHRVCRTALPHLRQRERAHIVVVGSLAGLLGIPFQGMYSATKFALEGYCEVLRMELQATCVRVAIVEPGDFVTGFTAARRSTALSSNGSAYRARFEAALEAIVQDETAGADPRLVGLAVERILEQDRPALRHAVGSRLQIAVARAKPVIPATVLQRLISGHYQC